MSDDRDEQTCREPCGEVLRQQETLAQIMEWKRLQNGDLREIRATLAETLRELREHKAFHLGREHQQAQDQGRFRWSSQMIVTLLGIVAGNSLLAGAVTYLVGRLASGKP